jgi:hypothetical protein
LHSIESEWVQADIECDALIEFSQLKLIMKEAKTQWRWAILAF